MTLNWHRNKISYAFPVFAGMILFFSAHFTINELEKKSLKLSPQETVLNFNEHFVKAVSFGQYRLLSGVLWSETLLKAGVDHYKEKDYKNWMFLRLKLITTLDPYFYSAYLFGGIYLSIIKDDDLGAEYIYDKGLRYYPKDLYLNLNASYHYNFEVNNPGKSISALERILDHPNAPPHLPKLLARFNADKGNLQDAKALILELYQASPKGSTIRYKHREQLINIQTEIDLNCLNSENSKSTCNTKNPTGHSYVKDTSNQRWISPIKWKQFKSKKKPSTL